jgi:alkylhydroperoxidase family enzyme
MARVPLPNRASITDPALQQRWQRLEERGPVINIFRLFMVNPAIELNARALWQASGLSPRSREIVILRAASTQESRYEWHQHVRIARSEGLSPAEIAAVRHWRDADCFSEDERALLAYVDALATDRRPSEEVYNAMARDRTPSQIVGVTMLISTYFSLALLMQAMDLETEEPFVGWDAGLGAQA